MKKSQLGDRNINIGIQLLRFLLCLWIVIIHCSHIKLEYTKYIRRSFHTPTFILLAFYFYYPLLYNRIITKIIRRFQRLLIPFIIWPSLFFILHNFSRDIFGIKKFKKRIPLKYLFMQFLIGIPIHGVFWFQFNLLFLSVLFSILSFIFKSNFLIVIQFLGIISLYFYNSKIYFNFFFPFPDEIRKNLSSIIELMPLTILGCIYSSLNLLTKVKNIPYHFQIILFSLLILFFKYDIFMLYKGFRYHNIFLLILVSLILFSLFGSLSFNNLKFVKIAIIHISKFTGGIYCIHTIAGDYLANNIYIFRKKTYFLSFFIYIICYFICFSGNKLLENYNLKYLFI